MFTPVVFTETVQRHLKSYTQKPLMETLISATASQTKYLKYPLNN